MNHLDIVPVDLNVPEMAAFSDSSNPANLSIAEIAADVVTGCQSAFVDWSRTLRLVGIFRRIFFAEPR